jgi:hypothetical protein
MKYILEFTLDGEKYRTTVEAGSDYHARKKLIDKCSRVKIDSCKTENPFQDGKDIMDFLTGFRK